MVCNNAPPPSSAGRFPSKSVSKGGHDVISHHKSEDRVKLLPSQQDRALRRISSMGGSVFCSELFLTGVSGSYDSLFLTLCRLKNGGYIMTDGAQADLDHLRSREIFLTDMGESYVFNAPKSALKLVLADIGRVVSLRALTGRQA